MSKLDTYYLLGRWTFRCQESGSSLSQAEPSSPSWNAVGSQAPQMGWGPRSCREGWVIAYRARWEQMASWGDQWVPAGIAECVYWPQRTPETLKTLQSRYCHLGATQVKTVKLLIVWVKKNGWDFQQCSPASIRGWKRVSLKAKSVPRQKRV